MASIKLRDAIKAKANVTYTRKPALHARTCDACGRVFIMRTLQGQTFGHLDGIFDCCAEDKDGRGLGNMFSADVCSFACAQTLYDGGWKKMKQYKPYVRAGASLKRVSLSIEEMLTEADIIAGWEGQAENEPPGDGIIWVHVGNSAFR